MVAGMGKGAVKPRSEGRHEPERGRHQDASEILLIVNPAAGAGRVRREWPRLAAEIRGEGIEFEEVFTSRPGEATDLARVAVKEGRRVVAAVGGDGILHEVVNGFFEGGEPIPTRSVLGLIPFGNRLAPRVDSLAGKRVGFADNDMWPSMPILMDELAHALRAEHGVAAIETVTYHYGRGHAGKEYRDRLSRLAESADVVISGFRPALAITSL